MPLTIQALPKGLVGLLDLNTGGAGPAVLADQSVGTVALEEHYWLFKRERVSQGGVAAGTTAQLFTFATTMTVPGNEAWLVYHFAISGPVALGLTIQMCPCIQLASPAGNQSLQIGPAVANQTSALASIITCYMDRGPILAPPGAILSGQTLAISAATAVTVGGTADVVKFRI